MKTKSKKTTNPNIFLYISFLIIILVSIIIGTIFILNKNYSFNTNKYAATKPTRTPTKKPTRTLTPTRIPQPLNCPTSSSNQYESLSTIGPKTDRPAAEHPDINLGFRGYQKNNSPARKLINLAPVTDTKAPQLKSILKKIPQFTNLYQVNNWIWEPPPDHKGNLVTDWETTAIGFGTFPGELIRVPNSGYDIEGGRDARVLYAWKNKANTNSRITLKYTREDNVVVGYTVHMESFCIDQNLLNLYNQLNSEGRDYLPALKGDDIIGTANNNQIIVALRDSGAFMDPRSCNDWWQGYCP